MPALPAAIAAEIAAIRADRESGASALLERAVAILRRALGGEASVDDVGRALYTAQPSMAGLLNAASEAVASNTDPDRFERFVQRLGRSPAALGRWGAAAFSESGDPLRLVTLSASRSVSTIARALAKDRRVHVTCAEGRPALEGRVLATELAATGVQVTFVSDAAIGTALRDVDAVLVGADAVTPGWFLNKVGTHMLAAAATSRGKPVYVAASRDKFLRESASRRLFVREGGASEVWSSPPPGVQVRNPYFEATPLDLITAIITDAGVLGAGMAADVCAASPDDIWLGDAPLPGNGTTRLP